MIKQILALAGISMAAATLAQNVLAQDASQAKLKQIFSYDVTIDPKFTAPKTPWGEPDLQGIWPLNHLIQVGLERNKMYGDRIYKTDAEFNPPAGGRGGRARATPEIPVADTSSRKMRQTSLIIDPPDGRFPALTDYGKKLQSEMKGSYKPGQTVFDNVDDFAAWDRCITRGMPASMEPRNYNNGIRIQQAPGYVVILLEMAHEARIIPTTPMPALDSEIKEYLGQSRGHWEGNTLVVETKNYNGLVGETSAGVPGSPGPLQPESPDMKTTERFTRVAADTIEYTMKIEDPKVLATGSFTIGYPMFLDNTYQMFEYACHEGNTAVRNYIETSRFERTHPKK